MSLTNDSIGFAEVTCAMASPPAPTRGEGRPQPLRAEAAVLHTRAQAAAPPSRTPAKAPASRTKAQATPMHPEPGEPPSLSQAEQELLDTYGGWAGFCGSYGLRPSVPQDAEEATQILRDYVWYQLGQKKGFGLHPKFVRSAHSCDAEVSGGY